jgi:hypothetical protein
MIVLLIHMWLLRHVKQLPLNITLECEKSVIFLSSFICAYLLMRRLQKCTMLLR